MTDSGPLPPPPTRGSSRGITGEAMGLLGSLGRHLEALTALAGAESKEAAAIYLRAAIAVVVALIAVIFGYIFLLLFVAFLLASVFGVAWIWITLGLGVLHLLGAVAGGLYAKSHFNLPVFGSTAAELRKDFESLKNFKP